MKRLDITQLIAYCLLIAVGMVGFTVQENRREADRVAAEERAIADDVKAAALAEGVLVLEEQLLSLGEVPQVSPLVSQEAVRIQGAPGRDGRNGLDGRDGASVIGPSGLTGSTGLTGSSGAAGSDGAAGAPGAPGAAGSPGPQGEPGPQGATGPQGETGEAGSTPTTLRCTADDKRPNSNTFTCTAEP